MTSQTRTHDLTKAAAALAPATSIRAATPRNVYEIQRIVADVFGIEARDLVSDRKPYKIATARHVAMFLCRSLLRSSMPGRLEYPVDFYTIAKAFERKQHGAVIYAVTSIRNRAPLEDDLAKLIVRARERLELSLS